MHRSRTTSFDFPKGNLRATKAFWSLTMYDGKTQLLVANPLKRYLLNSTTLDSIYLRRRRLAYFLHSEKLAWKRQGIEPVARAEWSIYVVFRVYMPGENVLSGTWKKPPMRSLPQKAETRPVRGRVCPCDQHRQQDASDWRFDDSIALMPSTLSRKPQRAKTARTID